MEINTCDIGYVQYSLLPYYSYYYFSMQNNEHLNK